MVALVENSKIGGMTGYNFPIEKGVSKIVC